MMDPSDEIHDDDHPTVEDALRRYWYTLTPQQYTDESSDVTDLLWQHVLELRAVRGWLVVVCALLLGAVTALVLLLLFR